MMDVVAAKTWLITGVMSGLGRALAEAALKRGDRVIGTVRTKEALNRFSQIVPGRSAGIMLDVTDQDPVVQQVALAETIYGGIDILCNNAGYGLVGGVEEASAAELRAQFEVNVFGAVNVMRAVLPGMRARRSGHIINITSVSGLVGWPGLGVYSGSKFALEGISETLAMEVAPLGIKVTMVEPGGFRTDFATRSRANTARVIDDYDQTVGQSRRILADHAGHERGDPARAADAVISIAGTPNPPLRLLLGADAVGYVREKLKAQIAEIDRWEHLSVSTDYSESGFRNR